MTEWVSVRDKLPDFGVPVRVRLRLTFSSGLTDWSIARRTRAKPLASAAIKIARLLHNPEFNDWYEIGERPKPIQTEVTHWMSLYEEKK